MKRLNETISARLLMVCLLCGLLLVAQGCITATVVTLVALAASSGEEDDVGAEHIATAQIDRGPEEIYGTAMAILQRTDGVEVIRNDPKKNRIDATRGANFVSIRAVKIADHRSEVVVAARAGEEGRSHQQLSLYVIETLCKDLGVQYRIVQ